MGISVNSPPLPGAMLTVPEAVVYSSSNGVANTAAVRSNGDHKNESDDTRLPPGALLTVPESVMYNSSNGVAVMSNGEHNKNESDGTQESGLHKKVSMEESKSGGDASADEDGESSSSDEYDEEKQEWEIAEISVDAVDQRDVGTADDWIRRHPELVRLTGRHPFNCEAPLPVLMQAGYITPTSLHYVRNHGYVPRAKWDEWRLEITGLVKRPTIFTMQQILDLFPPRELPVTLVCAGNRRKEENMVKQSIGFNWGPSAVSTSVWRGARLCDVLRCCGILSKKKGALYVCFEGGEILPGGGGSRYGTSLRVETAMDESCEVILAYQQNGKLLEPDHGFPIRILIPGYIGGRMVKWLTKIEVTEKESGNYYHFHDNRVLPSHVDAELAKAEGWWYRPDYIINELNVNSVITSPAHDEMLPINLSSVHEPYLLKGYAYSGGGRKVIRVEISLNDGESWRLCKVTHPSPCTKYGKYWCWNLWEVEVDLLELLQAKEIVVRAWDFAMNTQPQKITWNLMGMMNNCWYRVKVGACKHKDGGIALTFEHPTLAGNQAGGWMAKKQIDEVTQPALSKTVSTPILGNANVRQIQMKEVRKHSKPESVWIVVHNKVYDCTKFVPDHPGGTDSILINGGLDSTEEFDAIHSDKAKAMLQEYYIGDLAVSASDNVEDSDSEEEEEEKEDGPAIVSPSGMSIALNPKLRQPFVLIEKEILSHDVRRLRFGLQSENHVLGLPCGKHIFLSANVDGKFCMRAYTPTSNDSDVGFFELVIKIYYKDVHPKFPLGGFFSQFLDRLKIGDTIDVKGPVGHIHYLGRGNLNIHGVSRFIKRMSMLAGGTGITPMYQVIRAVLSDPEDTTEISLLYANRTEDDIMLRDQLDAWQAKHKNFKVWYTLSGTPKEGWQYSQGYINEEMVRAHLPQGDSETVALLCGPPALIESACLPNLFKLNYDESCCLQF